MKPDINLVIQVGGYLMLIVGLALYSVTVAFIVCGAIALLVGLWADLRNDRGPPSST